MRRLLPALLLLAAPVEAQGVRPAPADELEATRAELQAARAEVQRLRALAADAEAGRTTLAQCATKNARLVEIGQGLIAAYEKRYGRGQVGPFQLQRARFEAELQASGDLMHENKLDAAPPRVAPAPSQPQR
jgi:hypothetical protein